MGQADGQYRENGKTGRGVADGLTGRTDHRFFGDARYRESRGDAVQSVSGRVRRVTEDDGRTALRAAEGG